MPVWEYQTIELSGAALKAADVVNDAGAKGWELVAVVLAPGYQNLYHAIFKRPKPS